MRRWRSGWASSSREAVPAGVKGYSWRSRENVSQPSLWVDVVHLGRDDQGTHESSAVATTRRSSEEPGFAAEGDAEEGSFGRIIGEANPAIIKEAGKGFPATVFLEHVVPIRQCLTTIYASRAGGHYRRHTLFCPQERIEVQGSYEWPMTEGFDALVRGRRRQDAGVQDIAQVHPELAANEGKAHLSRRQGAPV